MDTQARSNQKAAQEAPECATIKKALQTYFLSCPAFAECALYADWLPEQPRANTAGTFSIYSIPCEPIVRSYTSGGSLRQYLFILRSVNAYSNDNFVQMENDGVFERLAEWVEKQSLKRNFPVMPDGMQAIRIAVNSTPYLESTTQKFGKYQIQCKLEYSKD